MRSKECQISLRAEVPRGEEMRTPDDVAAMLRLKALGWGIRRVARELECSHMTVRVHMMRKGQAKYACTHQPSLTEQFERIAA